MASKVEPRLEKFRQCAPSSWPAQEETGPVEGKAVVLLHKDSAQILSGDWVDLRFLKLIEGKTVKSPGRHGSSGKMIPAHACGDLLRPSLC